MQLQGQPGVFVGGSAGTDAFFVYVRERVHFYAKESRSVGGTYSVVVWYIDSMLPPLHLTVVAQLESSCPQTFYPSVISTTWVATSRQLCRHQCNSHLL